MQKIQFFEFTSSNSLSGTFEASFSRVWEGGGVWGVLSLFSGGKEIERIGNLLKDTILDLVMNTVEEDRIKVLAGVLDETQSTLKRILEEEDSADGVRLNIGLALIVDSALYFGKSGEIGFIIERGGEVLDIVQQLKQDEPVVISGNFNQDDTLVLTSCKIDLKDRKGQKWQKFIKNAGFLIGETKSEEAEEIDHEEFIEPQDNLSDLREENLPQTEIADPADNESEETELVEDSFVQLDEDKNEAEPNIPESENPADTENSARIKTEKLKQTAAKISGNLSPRVKSIVGVIYSKLGQGATWIGETIIGPGKRVRYKMPGGDLYKRRRMILLVLILAAGASLYFSVNWLKKKNLESNQVKEYETLSSEVAAILNDAENQAAINRVEALKLLNNASDQISRISTLEIEDNRWQEFTQRKLEIEDKIDNRVRIEKPEVVADLKIWFENADPSDLVYFDGSLWLTDPAAKALYKVKADSREVEQVLSAGDGLSEPRYLEIVEDKFYIYDVKKGLLEYDPGNNTVKEVTGLSPTTLGNVAEISSYDSSIYFLIPDAGRILKASPAGSGFSYPQTRLQDESFKSAKDIEINGLIYTLGAGELIRYYVDTRDSQLSISGLNPKLTSADKFELLSSLQVLVLDTDNKRVVVLDQPDGSSSIFKLNRQYTVLDSEDRYFNDLKEIVAAPAEGTAYVLDGFRVIKFQLNE